jgi:hypothetical protein
MAKNAKTNRYLLDDDQRTKEDILLKHNGLFKSEALYEPTPVEQPERRLSNRIGAAIRRENEPTEEMLEERSQEAEYEDSENAQEPQEDSILTRMMWNSTGETNSIPETIEHNRESYYIRNGGPSTETPRG